MADFIGVAESVILADFVGIGVSFAFEEQRMRTEKVGVAPKPPVSIRNLGRDIRGDLNHGYHNRPALLTPTAISKVLVFFDRSCSAGCNYPAAVSFCAISTRR
ncbi:hypothetical protein CK220_14710 [Mesorhizobium sp. WSM3860]|nr:hypothetical protein CK220_14710 [Mesorhizobium sp. WSM3860]